MRKHFYNEDYFKVIDSEDKAYWLGFISADGSVSKDAYHIRISLSSIDIKHLEKFLTCINANDVAIFIQHMTEGFSATKNGGSDIATINLTSMKMWNDLHQYNINHNKSYNIELPNIDDKMMPHYLRGFIDGDGSYHYHYDIKNNRYRYSFEIVGASQLMMKQIQEYFKLNGIKTNIYSRLNKNSKHESFRLMTGSRTEMLKIIDLIYADAHIYLDRKYKKINEIRNIAV